MNINKELSHIISKYEVDRYYPHYKNMVEAERILRNIINEVIRKKEKIIFVGDNPAGIKFIKNISRDYADIQFFCYKRNDFELESLEYIPWGDYKKVYLISLYNVEIPERWFRTHNISFQWLYSIFEEEGIFLQKEFFVLGQADMVALVDKDRVTHTRSNYTGMLQCELYSQKSRYVSAENPKAKSIALEKCLFLALLMKNFVEAEKYAAMLGKNDERFCSMWKEIEALLEKIKRELKDRKQENIILYWLDAVPYGDENELPYLRNIKKDAVVFENAFTNIAYTSSTARAVFLGKRDISDGVYNVLKFTEKNSPVMEMLKRAGYGIRIFSGMLDSCFSFSCLSEQFYMDVFEPCSVKLWDMIADMLSQEKKTFYLIHAMEAHWPYLSCRIDDDNFGDGNKRCRLAKLEMDEQLAYYDGMLSTKNYRIYMSDHGRKSSYKFHVVFNVCQETLRHRKVEGMFSLLDFHKVIGQLIESGELSENKLVKEYVEIGNLDRYDKGEVKNILKRRRALEERDFGCTGIIDKEYVYLRNTLGREQLFRREDAPTCDPLLYCDCEIDETELLEKYREMAGEYPAEMRKDKKFKYTIFLYNLYDNLKKRSGHVEKCVEIINKILEKFEENSVAVRVGGYHSLVLYHILSKENKRKIWGFIDKNGDCQCGRLGLPVVPVEKGEKLISEGVKAVLLSSYDILDVIRQETGIWFPDMEILDIYDAFEKRGIVCNTNFYNVLGTDEDYDVGFPFDEE